MKTRIIKIIELGLPWIPNNSMINIAINNAANLITLNHPCDISHLHNKGGVGLLVRKRLKCVRRYTSKLTHPIKNGVEVIGHVTLLLPQVEPY